jgi:hypothetical protein
LPGEAVGLCVLDIHAHVYAVIPFYLYIIVFYPRVNGYGT